MSQAPPSRESLITQQYHRHEYAGEEFRPVVLRPNAVSTAHWDDLARLGRNERGRLLEIGCGNGATLLAMGEQYDGLVGLDYLQPRIDIANSALERHYPHLKSKVQFICASADQRLPFDDGAFDVVMACVVLEFVADIFTALDELARVCRPGGCALIAVANVCYVKHVVDMLRGRIPMTAAVSRNPADWRKHGWDGGTLRYFSKRTLGDVLKHIGFVPEEWSGYGSYAKLRRWYLNLCGGICVRARRES